MAHLEALVKGVDVAQIASGDDHPVRYLQQHSSYVTPLLQNCILTHILLPRKARDFWKGADAKERRRACPETALDLPDRI